MNRDELQDECQERGEKEAREENERINRESRSENYVSEVEQERRSNLCAISLISPTFWSPVASLRESNKAMKRSARTDRHRMRTTRRAQERVTESCESAEKNPLLLFALIAAFLFPSLTLTVIE